jgi:hypothetical protein
MKTVTSVIVTVAALVTAQSQNLLVNGDFDLGNVGFTSTYIYSPGDTVPERTYAVISDPSFTHGRGERRCPRIATGFALKDGGGFRGGDQTGRSLIRGASGAVASHHLAWLRAVREIL